MSFRLNIDNILETNMRELRSREITSTEYESLYNGVSHERLRTIFSWLHAGYINLFGALNRRLPTGENSAHFWADPSRDLNLVIGITLSLQNSLQGSEWAFAIDEYYDTLIKQCCSFLSNSGGSVIPPHMAKITLCYVEPIFRLKESVIIKNESRSIVANLVPIGDGSYAKVFRYTDNFYKRDFALKRAKSNLSERERLRFRKEFEEMQSLHSPYIVEVYAYDERKHQYIMELMDFTLEKYINTNNSSMPLQTRKSIIRQLLRAYRYLHSKKMYHRDISLRNVLLKQYDDVLVVKLSDFGLVKTENSDLTSENTDFKGSLNDPVLKVEGFSNYGLIHELFAITLQFTYVLTGKTNWAKITNPIIKPFMIKGTNSDKSERFQTLEELEQAVELCFTRLEKRNQRE